MTDPIVSDSRSPAVRVLGVVLAVGVVVALVAGGVFLVLAGGGGDDGDDDSASAVAADDEEPAADTEPEEPEEPTDETPETTVAPTTTTTVPAEVDLLRNDPRPAIDAFLGAYGGNASAIEIVLYPDYAFLEVRNPDRPRTLQRVQWRDGALDPPEPEQPFPGTDLDAESYRLGRPAWDALPDLVARAPQQLGLPRGEVTHVIVHSDLPFNDRIVFRVYVSGANGSDFLEADLDGRILPP